MNSDLFWFALCLLWLLAMLLLGGEGPRRDVFPDCATDVACFAAPPPPAPQG